MANTTNYSWNLPTVGGNQDAWGDLLNANWTALDTLLGGTSAAEFAILDGATVTTAELNYVDGVTSNIQTQLNSLNSTKAPTASPTFTGTVTIPTAAVTTVDLGDWTITESAGVLYFATGGVNKMKLDASGNLTVTGNVTAYGSV
jgi:hypothetical protein